jgi:hypothetical protein
MREIFELLRTNRGLAERIDGLKKTTPGFLSKWWEPSTNAGNIPSMINKVEEVLV